MIYAQNLTIYVVFFFQNGFSVAMVNKCISKKLDSIYEPPSTVSTVPKQIIHCKIPFMSNFLNKQLNSEVVKLVSKFFPQVNLR